MEQEIRFCTSTDGLAYSTRRDHAERTLAEGRWIAAGNPTMAYWHNRANLVYDGWRLRLLEGMTPWRT